MKLKRIGPSDTLSRKLNSICLTTKYPYKPKMAPEAPTLGRYRLNIKLASDAPIPANIYNRKKRLLPINGSNTRPRLNNTYMLTSKWMMPPCINMEENIRQYSPPTVNGLKLAPW